MADCRPARRGQLTTPPEPAAAQSDPFGTAELRRDVLDAWTASPARFREDANAEEALAVGGYAGRVLVELASNAVDAGREAGVPRASGSDCKMANSRSPIPARS